MSPWNFVFIYLEVFFNLNLRSFVKSLLYFFLFNKIQPNYIRDWKSVTEELLKTERDYVDSLNYVTQNYIPMLETNTHITQQSMHSSLYEDHVPTALRGKKLTIFGNIKKLTEFHTNIFQRKLELCRFKPFNVGRVFLEHVGHFFVSIIEDIPLYNLS